MYRRNYRNRSSIKSEFSPSLRKASTPNYYQRKGRTIQQTPLSLCNIPTETMTRKKLDKLYQLLVQYKYQFPERPLPSIGILPFMINTDLHMYEMFPSVEGERNYHFGGTELNTLALSLLQSSYPAIVNLYNWHFQLLNIQFLSQEGLTIDNNKQYFINWNSNLLSDNNFQIFIKSIDIGILSSLVSIPIEARPNGVNSETGNVIIRTDRVSVTPSGKFSTISTSNLQTNDNNISDNAQYPFIDTRSGEFGLYHGELEFVPSTGIEEGGLGAIISRLYILCIPNQ